MTVDSWGEVQILHVDDEVNFTDLTKTFLERDDDQFAVETATSADEGLECISDRPPDCVVSDYNMPGTDGLEFLQAVRESHPNLPFILFTAKGSEAVASDAISAGVTDYIQKRSSTEQYELLANRIRNAVRSSREARRADRKEQLMRLTEFAGDTGGFELDRESGTILLTAGARRIIGRPDQHELPLEEAIELFHPDDRNDVRQTVSGDFETGEEVHRVWRLRPGDGRERLLEVDLTPVVENGEVTKLRGAGNDITDRRERQRALEQIETVFEHAQDSLFLIDAAEEFRIERVNPAWEDATGLSAERVRGKTPRDVLGEQSGAVAESKYSECVQHREPLQYEETARFDGELTHWTTRIAPVVVDETVRYIAGSTRDVTDRKTRQQELEQARELMANMERLADVGAWKYDPATDAFVMTAGAYRIYGLEPDADITLEAAFDLVHPADRERLTERFDSCLETGEPYELDVRLTTAEGAQRWITARGERVSDGRGGSVVRGYIRDITEQQAHERDLKRYRTIFNELPDPVVVYDDEGRYELVNDAAVEIRDASREELVGTKSPYLGQIRESHPAEYDALAEGARDTLRTELTDEFPGRGERTLACDLTRVTAGRGPEGTVIVTRDITEREERRTELEEYETIIEALTDAVYVLDEAGRFTYVNEELVELVGYDREAIIGSTPSLIKDDDDVERAEHQLGRLLSSDGPGTVTFEVTIQPRDGDPIVCEDRMGVLPYEGEAFDGSVGVLRDTTDRKERKRRLRNERDRFRSIFDGAFDAMAIADDDGEYLDVNERAAELFGLPEEELLGQSIEDFAPDEFDFEAAWQEFQQSQRERDTFPLVRPDGTERLVEYAAATDIVPGQHLSILRDVTERRRHERRFRALVEESNDVISIVDADGRYQYQSPSIERILGYDPEETIGDTVWEYIHPDDRETAIEQFEAWVNDPEGVPDAPEYRARHADGSWRWMEADGNAQLDNPAVEGYVVNSRDITARKERQQQLELLDRVLRHNLRNDMNVIRGAAETIRDRGTDMTASFAEQIIETSDQLLDTAETEREMTELLQDSPEFEAITVGPLLRDVASSIGSEYPDAEITVECPGGVTIRATKQFEQATRELVTNAVIHDDGESPTVAISVVPTDETTRIEFADTGPRIPEMERNVLLNKEEQTPVYHGAGLGLWLVRLIVSRSGGYITFEQNSPTGNIVILELPE